MHRRLIRSSTDYEDAVAAFGIPFEVAEIVPAQAAFANGGDVWLPLRKRRRVAMAWMDFAGVPGVPHGRAHGHVFR